MSKKHIHIISHTHWDREWYLPYEKHHVKLIELVDELLETLDNNADFKSFHLDGQTIILDDYLQIRPEMKDRIQHYIQEGSIHVGPWYILQDEFLTSSESNVRNLQYGMQEAAKWGSISKVGYFPDSFGNIGQAAQILKQAGINNAVFGRGVKPTGFNNMVSETDDYESPYSEMIWRAPDGSSVLGILFANWYCNGNEIPTDKTAAKEYWDQHLASMEKYAATPNLLMMNGCDHQPIQTDLPVAIQTAESLYPDIEFVHSNFDYYIKEMIKDIPDNLKVIDGELRSQQTDGWGTLVNTASARVYLKQMNQIGQTLLEKVAEPLASFASLRGKNYPHHLFSYAWKILMQNHPHDSICGCSVDEVHREMVTRFEKSKHVTETMIDESLTSITKEIDTSSFEKWGNEVLPFAVYNTTGWERTGTVTVILDIKREYFSSGVNKQDLKSFPLAEQEVVDELGAVYSCHVEDLGISFGYDLPNNKFRQPYMARRVRLSFEARCVPAMGYKTFALVPIAGHHATASLIKRSNEMANDHIHVKIMENGALTIKHKATGKTYEDVCIYEDTGDIGNEYMYKQPTGEHALTTNDLLAKVKIQKDTPYQAVFEIIHEWKIPRSASELLEREQKELIDFRNRKAIRSGEKVPFTIKTLVTLDKNSRGVDIKVSYNNVAKDHRLRVLIPTDIKTDVHIADSAFEAVKRFNHPTAEWTNPDNSQHQQSFVDVSDDTVGVTVANRGLNEYEVLRDNRNTIALTLLRAVGELGDWGHFPTPEAQCLGEHTVSFSIFPHQGNAFDSDAIQNAYQYQVPWSVKQTYIQGGTLPSTHSFIKWEAANLALSSLKVAEKSGDVMVRWFNPTNKPEKLIINTPDRCSSAYMSNIIEEKVEKLSTKEVEEIHVHKHEIITIGFVKE